jgi:hypothetical protein
MNPYDNALPAALPEKKRPAAPKEKPHPTAPVQALAPKAKRKPSALAEALLADFGDGKPPSAGMHALFRRLGSDAARQGIIHELVARRGFSILPYAKVLVSQYLNDVAAGETSNPRSALSFLAKLKPPYLRELVERDEWLIKSLRDAAQPRAKKP